MRLTDIFIRRPVLAVVVNLIILIAGLQAIRSVSVRQYPRIESATVTVRNEITDSTIAKQAGPQPPQAGRAMGALQGLLAGKFLLRPGALAHRPRRVARLPDHRPLPQARLRWTIAVHLSST